MRIVIPVLNFGKSGGYRVLSKIADELICLGHTVRFMSPETSALPYFPTKADIFWVNKDGEIVERSEYEKRKKDSGFYIFLKLFLGLKKLNKDSYDVIIANHSLTAFIIKCAGLKNKSIYYVQAYEAELLSVADGLKNKVLAYFYSLSYKMNFFTIVNAKIYLNYKKLKASRVLYPGVDFDLFYPDKKNPSQEKKIIIGTIGRLEKFKGTSFVVDAFKELKKKYPELQLHMAFADSNDFKQDKDIYCFHPKNDSKLADFYRSLDFYICAGYIQLGAFHYPVVEAMSCGIPVITTQYYPANETNAWMIRPKNKEDFVSQFELAMNNRLLKEKKIEQALDDVKQFDWKVVGKKLENYLNDFLQLENQNKGIADIKNVSS